MGHLRQRNKGSWQIVIHQGYSQGKAVIHYETVKGPKEKAIKRMRELEYGLDHGMPISSSDLTVEAWLTSWMDGYVKARCTARTQEGYGSIVRNHLIPGLGHHRLSRLRPEMIEAYYGKKLETLNPRTVIHHHRVLSQALREAERKGHVGRNPCSLAVAPSPGKRQMRTLNLDEVRSLLEAAQESRWYPVIYTALNSGLRQAELLGLRWRDVDLDEQTISVCQTLHRRQGKVEFKEPKTSGSRRRVDMTEKLASYLREYRASREVLYLENGKVLGPDSLVFASDTGKPFVGCVLSHDFAIISRRAGVQGLRYHDLRHSFASLMLMRGAPAKVISEALGHASVAFTMDTYSHLMKGMQKDAMRLLDDVLPTGIVGGRSS